MRFFCFLSTSTDVGPKSITITGDDQEYNQTQKFVYLGSQLNAEGDISTEIQRRQLIASMKMNKLSRQLFDNKAKWLSFKVVLFKQEVLETLLYGCPTWTLKESDYARLTTYHRKYLHRLTGFRKDRLDETGKRLISYRHLLRITGCECIEALVRRRRLTFAGHLVRMEDGRLLKLMLLGELKSHRKSRKGARKTWLTCLSDDLKRFNIDKQGWVKRANDEAAWAKEINDGAEFFKTNWIKKENAKHNNRVAARLKKQEVIP